MAVSWPDQHEPGWCAHELTCCAGAGSLWTETVCGKLRNVGLPLYLPNGAAPNLSLILGGAGAKLEDMAAAYTAFARHGKAGKLRLQPDADAERPLMSSGAAWIIRRIMADEACTADSAAARRPTGMENGHQLWLS